MSRKTSYAAAGTHAHQLSLRSARSPFEGSPHGILSSPVCSTDSTHERLLVLSRCTEEFDTFFGKLELRTTYLPAQLVGFDFGSPGSGDDWESHGRAFTSVRPAVTLCGDGGTMWWQLTLVTEADTNLADSADGHVE